MENNKDLETKEVAKDNNDNIKTPKEEKNIWDRYTTEFEEEIEVESEDGSITKQKVRKQSVNVKSILLELEYRQKLVEELCKLIVEEKEAESKAKGVYNSGPQIILP